MNVLQLNAMPAAAFLANCTCPLADTFIALFAPPGILRFGAGMVGC
jgi:hypothetical protein